MSFAAFPAPPSEDVQLDTQLYTMIELESNRYRAFFSNLSGGAGAPISRDAALEFFRKSSLSEEQVQELYVRLKEQQLLRDHDHMNETEFIMGMHLIVCITKRNLVKIPPKLPGYLFPMLDLTPEKPPSIGFPRNSQVSSNTPLVSSTDLMGANNQSVSPKATASEYMGASLVDAKSLSELVNILIHRKQHEAGVLLKVDQSEKRALQNLQACMERIADQVDGLGFPVPSSARSLDSIDDLKHLLQKHVHSAKQEIQTMQIDARMRSVALEVAQNGTVDNPLSAASHLAQELGILQHQTTELMAKNACVVERLVAIQSGKSTAESINFGRMGSKNSAFAFSKGALTVGELGTGATATTPITNGELPLKPAHNKAPDGGWGTFGAPQSFNPRQSALNDRVAIGSAVPQNVFPGVTKSEATPVSTIDFTWGSF